MAINRALGLGEPVALVIGVLSSGTRRPRRCRGRRSIARQDRSAPRRGGPSAALTFGDESDAGQQPVALGLDRHGQVEADVAAIGSDLEGLGERRLGGQQVALAVAGVADTEMRAPRVDDVDRLQSPEAGSARFVPSVVVGVGTSGGEHVHRAQLSANGQQPDGDRQDE